MDSANDHLVLGSGLGKSSALYKWLFHRLKKLPLTTLELVRPNGQADRLGKSVKGVPVPRIRIYREKAILRAMHSGMLGWAEAYMAEEWDTPDLLAVTDWAMANEQVLEESFSGDFVSAFFNRLTHLMRANTKKGSKKNIAAHYDLGNSFYQLWLDKTMTYSSALYRSPTDSIEQAQSNKYRRIIELLDVQDQQQVLEIGCGWGGFADELTRLHDISGYTGITLSEQQLMYARDRMQDKNDYCRFQLKDYRDLSGQYDRIASIEMIEAVGAENWPVYFKGISRRLKTGGVAVVQAITIADDRLEGYLNRADFIQKYIFPGGALPSREVICSEIKKAGMVLQHSETFGQDYASTLAVWRHRFNRSWPAIAEQGFDERFKRMWNYYLTYCQTGFKKESINVCLFVIKKN
ncbi:cyclopropane-fatty-acyl-phospholipid synthase family protein [Endozoicomonas sp. Mp262]|uniref:class I SAM-dependent methyltransferase n=1 Tax=Endozoicomonas sp. Mp262 TaxID=2919499 RepID=UPI0021DAD3D1